MVSMTISDVPEDLLGRLRKRAEQTGRSVEREALRILEGALTPAHPGAVQLPEPIQPLLPISGDDVVRAIREARDDRG